MFILESVNWIEDYYRTNSFVGIYSSKELAQKYIDSSQAKAMENNYVSYLESQFTTEFGVLNEKGKAETWTNYIKINSQKPKFKGDQKDKEALKIHAALKQEWNEKSAKASEIHQKFLWEKIYEPAKLKAEKMRGSEIPPELLDKVKEWGYRFPEYEIKEVELDQEFKAKEEDYYY